MSDWRLLGLALGFVFVVALIPREQFNARGMRLAALFILTLWGSKTALPLLTAGFNPAPAMLLSELPAVGESMPTRAYFTDEDRGMDTDEADYESVQARYKELRRQYVATDDSAEKARLRAEIEEIEAPRRQAADARGPGR